MDGQTLTRELRQLINEAETSSFLDLHSSYDYLYEAAVLTSLRLQLFKSSQTITTVANQAEYYLNSDFAGLYLMNNRNQKFIKYLVGSAVTFLYETSYDNVVLTNNTTAVTVPSQFTIIPANGYAQITGNASSGSTGSGGECTLIINGETFITKGVTVGDLVHNTTDSSDGVVLAVTNETTLQIALFDGTNNYITSGDAVIINPQGRFKLVLDPAPSNSGDSIVINYIKRPDPVYALYRRYPFPIDFKSALVNYSAWKYKYRDREPNFGDKLFMAWDLIVRRYGKDVNTALGRQGYKVNLVKTASGSGSFR